MARLSRIIAVGYPHHLTQRGVRSMAIFQSDADRRCYLQYVKEETERFGVEILSSGIPDQIWPRRKEIPDAASKDVC